MTLAAIPSPSTAVWHVFGLPIRAYALCIVLGIVVACLITDARLRQRGVAPWAVLDLAVWAVPFGIVGARIYHVLSSPQDYFGAGGTPIRALYIWEGGLGIWGGVAGGALGAWIAARQLGLPLTVFADAVAPALPLAQAVGRFGNWFNNELYGSVTTLPWGLQIHEMDRNNPGHATRIDGEPVLLPDLYHPTFLYEALWNVGVAILVFVLDRKYKFGRGRGFALYVMAYTAGRFWVELLRTDAANHFFGIRLNVFTSVLVFLGGLAYFLLVKGTREYVVPIDAVDVAPAAVAAGDVSGFGSSPLDGPAADGSVSGSPGVGSPGVGSPVDGAVPGERAPGAPPVAYRVVSEERFAAYQRTGVLPPADEPVSTAEADATIVEPTTGSTTTRAPAPISEPSVPESPVPAPAVSSVPTVAVPPAAEPTVAVPTVAVPSVAEPSAAEPPVQAAVVEPTPNPEPAAKATPRPKPKPTASIDTQPAGSQPVETRAAEIQAVETAPAEIQGGEALPVDATSAEAEAVNTQPVDAKPVAAQSADIQPDETQAAHTQPATAGLAAAKPVAAKPVAAKPVAAKPVAAKPVAAKPVDTQAADTKAAEAKPAGAKPAGAKPAAQPADARPAETRPAETRPAETRPAETRPADAQPAGTPSVEASAGDDAAGEATARSDDKR